MRRIISIIGCLVIILSFTTLSKAIPIVDKTDIQKEIDENIRKLEEPDISIEEAEEIVNRTTAVTDKLSEYENIWKEKYPITEENEHDYLCSLREWLFDYEFDGVESFYLHDDYLTVHFEKDGDLIYQPEIDGISLD